MGTQRKFPGVWGRLVTGLAALGALYHILYAADFFEYFNIYLFGIHRGLSFSFILVLALLLIPATKKSRRDRLPWYDALLIAAALATTLYWVSIYSVLYPRSGAPTTLDQAMAVAFLVVIIEAARRAFGWIVAVLGLVSIVYPLVGEQMPGLLFTRSANFVRIAGLFYLSPEGVWGSVMEVFTVTVSIYIIFGQFVLASGAGDFFTKLAFATIGRFRGGAAKASVISSALFGTLSGSAVSNVAVTGSVTIPMMKKTGFPGHVAGAVEAVASTGGMIMPPVMGSVVFIMADILQVSYWKIALAAFIPAFLYYITVYTSVQGYTVKLGVQPVAKSEVPPLWKTLREGWQFFLPIGVLIYFLGIRGFTPEKAAVYALFSAVIVSFFRRETWLTPRKAVLALEEGGKGVASIGTIAGVMGLLLASVNLTGLGIKLSSGLVDAAGGSLIVLMLLAALSAFIMGMGVSLILSYIVLALFVAPAMIGVGVSPMAAHLFLIYWSITAVLTPPVALAAFVGAAIAQADYFKTGWVATRLGVAAFVVPFMFVFRPALLLQGTPFQIAAAGVVSALGLVAIATAITGYLMSGLSWWERLLLMAGGILSISPGAATDVLGLALIAYPLARQAMGLLVRPRAAPLPAAASDPPERE